MIAGWTRARSDAAAAYCRLLIGRRRTAPSGSILLLHASRASGPWRVTPVVRPDRPDPSRSVRDGPVALGGHRIVPATAWLALIVNTTDCPDRPPAFVHAPHGRPVQFDGECSSSYLHLTLSPPVAARILGVSLGSLGDGLVDLRELLGRDGSRIVERIRDELDRSRQAALLEEGLRARFRAGTAPSPGVVHAWRRLDESGGDVSIGLLSKEVGWTHKHLIDQFRREIGIPPKTAARLLRLNRLWRSLDRIDAGTPPRNGYRWAELAADAGYADQSHLIREVRRFTGSTPTDYLARRRPGRHGGPLSAVAGELPPPRGLPASATVGSRP